MKVLLVNPAYPFEEFPTPPFGLMSLAAYLLEEGFEVRIEDYIITHYSKERVAHVVKEYNPDVVGATSVTMNVKTALGVLQDYQQERPDIITVMGGPHVTFDAENILRDNSHVDFIVRGEGEVTFTELLEVIGSRSPLGHVRGISYRDDARILHNEERPLIEDINILPYPARYLVPLSRYKALTFPINMITSRGCPYNCIFCLGGKMMGRKVRYFDVMRVVDEFEMLSSMGFKQINIVDDLFTSNKDRCIAICDEIIRRKISHPWNAFARVNTVSKDLLKKMKKAGCTMLCFGIESGDQKILNTIEKKITLEEAQRAIQLCVEVGMDSLGSYILGLPGESHETVHETLRFAADLNPAYGFHILAPFPGTEVRERNEEYGIKILTDDWNQYDANRSVSETPGISGSEIDRIVNGFTADIDAQISILEEKKKQSLPMSEKHIDFIENRNNFHFTRDLILNRLVEKYPGLHNGEEINEVINDFAFFIENNIDFPLEEVMRNLTRLFAQDCLKVERSAEESRVRWSE
ncbi:MAG: radical SAM protein [Thermodesulfobacteriota bacterium]|nr:radical SAM protein [Thermodesulfobacteriota bacterium]